MRNVLLILMLLLLPWQAATAAQRNFVHLLGGASTDVTLVGKHIAEHEAHIFHHHDHEHDDGDDEEDAPPSGMHEDDSDASTQHLSDYEHGGSLHLLLQAAPPLPMSVVADVPPVFIGIAYMNRTALPLLRPPCLPA
ncbi:MAG: hypothetical protein V4754_20175 [Pseudomonadota bacterium]